MTTSCTNYSAPRHYGRLLTLRAIREKERVTWRDKGSVQAGLLTGVMTIIVCDYAEWDMNATIDSEVAWVPHTLRAAVYYISMTTWQQRGVELQRCASLGHENGFFHFLFWSWTGCNGAFNGSRLIDSWMRGIVRCHSCENRKTRVFQLNRKFNFCKQ